MVGDSSPFLVQAIYSFKGKNNDELCFKKGDIITITQREEGGWWEGTLGEKTGWFPSNYVKEHKLQDNTVSLVGLPGNASPTKSPSELVSQQKVYRNVVLRDIIDSEKANVSELQGLLKNFLHPLEKSEILTREEYRQLVGNIGHVLETHQQLLAALEDCNQRAPPDQRVGKVFLTSAPRIKQVHQAYCTSHPKAVCILDKYKDELNSFMESQGAASPGLLVLTTGLSKPFRRLEKYAGMLQELERHVEENHPDRGDTQRSVSVYKDIASACSGTRRQKELELEVLTGGVRGWEGEDLSCLGEILHMGSVAVGPDHRDRYLVLFPSTLLMLSVSQRMSAFIYEGKLPLTGINVNKLEDSDVYKNAFEITGPMIERIVAICQTREDQTTWVDIVKRHIRVVASSPAVSPPPSKPQPLPPPHVSVPPACPYATLTAYFADLVVRGLITRAVLKRLLYAQLEGVVDILGVRVRHSHKVECVVYPTKVSKTTLTWIKSSSGGSSSSRSGTLRRQNAFDYDDSSSCGSCESNPFGFIRVFPDDHVETFKCFVDDSPDSLSVKDSSNDSGNNNNQTFTVRTSSETDSTPAPEYVSKASLTINCKKDSETRPYLKVIASLPSDESSFERSSAHNQFSYAASACQDLAHLDDHVSMETTSSADSEHVTNQPSCEMRQSLPATLSSNLSNKIRYKPLVPPKPLALCAPAYQSISVKDLFTSCRGAHLNPRNQVCHSLPSLPCSDSYSPPTPTTHSSNLDIPTNMIRVPSAMFAELLYGQASQSNPTMSILEFIHQQESVSSDHSTGTIRTVREREKGVSTHELPFRKPHHPVCADSNFHSLNRQKMTEDSIRGWQSGTTHFTDPDNPVHGMSTKCSEPGYCRCCGYVPLPCSSRSSDSGLADITGTSTLPSPDLSSPLLEPNSPDVSNYPPYIDPHNSLQRHFDSTRFETQCTCTPPFGSMPRTSTQPSLTSDIIFAGSTESVPSVMSSCLDMSPLSSWRPATDENIFPMPSWPQRADENDCSVTSQQPREDDSVCPVPLRQPKDDENVSQTVHSETKDDKCEDTPDEQRGHHVERRRTFRSGMYAHWWLKAKIPASALMSRSSTPSPPPQTDVIAERAGVSQSQPTTSQHHATR